MSTTSVPEWGLMITLGSSSMSKWVPFLVQEKLMDKNQSQSEKSVGFKRADNKLSVISQETRA